MWKTHASIPDNRKKERVGTLNEMRVDANNMYKHIKKRISIPDDMNGTWIGTLNEAYEKHIPPSLVMEKEKGWNFK